MPTFLKRRVVMAVNLPLQTAYGESQPLINVFPTPIVSKRNPLTTDRAQLGTEWVNKSTNSVFVLTSVTANSSTWVALSGGAGTFSSLVVNPGNITATAGNISATAGSLSAGTTVTAGTGITATTGNIVASTGNIIATLGSITSGNLTSGIQLGATGDLGNGFASVTSVTNVTNTSQSTGTLAVKSTTANAGNNAGFLKVYVGLTTAYIPYFTNIAP
jgi:hypothetical protein